MINIADIQAAADRIGGKVRYTPVIAADQFKAPATDAHLTFKLEYLQVTGSFKARGAMNRLLATPTDQMARGVVAASGGNHGLAVARAAFLAQVPATIYVPTNVSESKIDKLRQWEAEVVVVGDVWDETNLEALRHVERTGAAYFHPFADPLIVAGQGTIGLEVLEQCADIDTVVLAIGGGGLIAGVSTAIKALRPDVRVIGVEATGAPTLQRSLQAGKVVTLDKVTTSVPTLACARTDERIFELVRDQVDQLVLVDDEALRSAARWLWFEMGIAADLSGVAALAALHDKQLQFSRNERVCVVLCGAGPDPILMG